MIGYQMVGTNDLKKSGEFYDALLAGMGAARMMEDDRFIVWATDPKQPAFSVTLPYDGERASVGNGSMTAFSCKDRALVDKLHAKALELGAANEGDSGPRGESGFYAGYFRDPDGNKLNFFCMET